MKFSLGWQNCMPAFTTIINNIYLVLIPVGILIGTNAVNQKEFLMTFIFYLLFVPAVAGILNKIMYVSDRLCKSMEMLQEWTKYLIFQS